MPAVASLAALSSMGMFGAPDVIELGGVVSSFTSIVGGTGYSVDDPITATGGGGTGFAAHVATLGGSGAIASIAIDNGGKDYTSAPTLDFSGGGGTSASATAVLTNKAWLLRYWPQILADEDVRGLYEYLFSGATATGAQMIMGRRVAKTIYDAPANKRITCEMDFADGLGHGHSGFPIAKTGNTGTFAGVMTLRGIRPNDSDFVAGHSLYLKVTAHDSTSTTFKAAYAAASGYTDGTHFATPTYGTNTFVVTKSDLASTDGYGTVVDSTTGDPIGIGNEDNLVLSLGISSGWNDFAVDDQFEVPVQMGQLDASYTVENRFSAFHLALTAGGSRGIRTDKATIEIDRGFTPYQQNGSPYPSAIDPTGDVKVTVKLDERLFDNFWRTIRENNASLTLYSKISNILPIAGSSSHEGVEIYGPQARVSGLVERGITTKDTMKSAVTLEFENPDETTPGPGDHFPGTYPVQINVTIGEDPTDSLD
jgi:hypothetical protein